jgi:hypothetical protein
MRSMLLAGFALTAVAAIAPAHAQTTGGVPITRGGGSVNVSKQSATTLGSGPGRVITSGGNNYNKSLGAYSLTGTSTRPR